MLDWYNLTTKQLEYYSIKKEGQFELCGRYLYYKVIRSKPGHHFINKYTKENVGAIHYLGIYPYDKDYNFLDIPRVEQESDFEEVADD